MNILDHVKMNHLLLTTRSGLRRASLPLASAWGAFTEEESTQWRMFQNQLLWNYQILDPNSDIVTRWNYMFLATNVFALFIDPLYFFLPSVGDDNACLQTDKYLLKTVTVLRTLNDLFYVLNILIKFRTAYISKSSRVFGRGELVMDPILIASRYIRNDFLIDFTASLPLPQIMNWFIIPKMKRTKSDQTNYTLSLIVLLQYIPRFFLMFPLNRRIIKTTGVVAKNAWCGAAYNLLLYMLASHVLGSVWYTAAISRQYSCWRAECDMEKRRFPKCLRRYLDCSTVGDSDRKYWLKTTKLVMSCDPRNERASFKFGMFAEAFTSGVGSARFIRKYVYCLWFGLKNLSSYGQNLETTTYIGETLFAISVCIAGLFLFSLLIGNMQTYLQSLTVRVEEWRVKRRDTEEWMRHRQLPPSLQERVRKFVQYNWLATRGVNEAAILRELPLDLRREIQRHLCLNLVRRVPFFAKMDELLLDAMCERLVATLSTQGTYIFREDDPVDEMLFIIRGKLESSTTGGGRSGFFNSIKLRPGDFCGEELLTWALLPNASVSLPASTRTVKALTEVEAFALGAEDLTFFSSQFKRLHSKALQDAFRYYSHQWRAWGACYIQTAWRRHKKRRMAKELALQESMYYEEIWEEDTDDEDDDNTEGEASSQDKDSDSNFGATVYASKFAANTRKGTRRVKKIVASSTRDMKMPKMFKPNMPEF